MRTEAPCIAVSRNQYLKIKAATSQLSELLLTSGIYTRVEERPFQCSVQVMKFSISQSHMLGLALWYTCPSIPKTFTAGLLIDVGMRVTETLPR